MHIEKKYLPWVNSRKYTYTFSEHMVRSAIALVTFAIFVSAGIFIVDKTADAVYGSDKSDHSQGQYDFNHLKPAIQKKDGHYPSFDQIVSEEIVLRSENLQPAMCTNYADCSMRQFKAENIDRFKAGDYGRYDYEYRRIFKNPREARTKINAAIKRYFAAHPKRKNGNSLDWWYHRAMASNCMGYLKWARFQDRGHNSCKFTIHKVVTSDGSLDWRMSKQEFIKVGSIMACATGLVVMIATGQAWWVVGLGAAGCTWEMWKQEQ